MGSIFGGDIAAGPMPRETIELVRSIDDAVSRAGQRRPARDLAKYEGEAGRL